MPPHTACLLLTLFALAGSFALAAEPAPPAVAAQPTAEEVQLRKEREAADALVPTTQPASRFPKWESQALSRIAKGKAAASTIQVVFDGDSITNGWIIPERGLKVWKERLEPYQAFDFGISGDKTQHVLWRLAQGQAEGLHPKLIVLLVGTNNLGRTWTPTQVAEGIQEVASQYHRRCPEAAILVQGILPRGDAGEPLRSRIKEVNAALAAWAPKAGVLFRDFGDRFLEPDGRLKADCFIDKTHPNEKGYTIWADAIQDVLDAHLPHPPAKP